MIGEQTMASEEFDQRPWGSFTVLIEHPNHKVKRIQVEPGMRLSYQRHRHRAEHWFIVEGTGTLTIDGRSSVVQRGASVDIPNDTPHRIANTGDDTLVFIEVQHGEYFGEDDIVRIEDDFGRVESAEF